MAGNGILSAFRCNTQKTLSVEQDFGTRTSLLASGRECTCTWNYKIRVFFYSFLKILRYVYTRFNTERYKYIFLAKSLQADVAVYNALHVFHVRFESRF